MVGAGCGSRVGVVFSAMVRRRRIERREIKLVAKDGNVLSSVTVGGSGEEGVGESLERGHCRRGARD